jgi:hypothetical protein
MANLKERERSANDNGDLREFEKISRLRVLLGIYRIYRIHTQGSKLS